MANTGNTQQQIDYGAAANDGQGDPLRTAFIKTDDNFDAIWNTGPVGSNITILNNTVQSNNTNGNIVLRPNGVGVIQANAAIIPNATNLRDLGSANQRFRAAYVGTGGLSVDGNVTVTGNLTAGNISYTGNVFVGDLQGSVYADDSTIMVDAVDNAVFADSATFGRANVTGNVTANYFIGNGSLLTGIASSYGNADVINLLANFGSNTISTFGNIGGNFVAPGGNGQVLYNRDGVIGASPTNFNFDESTLTLFIKTVSASGNVNDGRDAVYAGVPGVTPLGSDVILQAYGNAAAYSQINMENISDSPQASGDFIITADNGTDSTHFVNIGMASSNWDGTQPNSLGANVGPNDGYIYTQDGNLVIGVKSGVSDMYLWRFTDQGITGTGNIIPSANAVYSLGNATNYWSNLWVANNTIYIGGVPLGIAGNTLTVNGEPVTGNITFSDTTMSPPDEVDITISAANSEVIIEAFDIRLDATDDLRLTGSDLVSLRNRSTTDPVTIITDYDDTETTWTFAVDGTLTTPGDITVGGDITGRAAANTLVLKAQPDSNTLIQLNSIVDSTVSIAANLDIVTDSSNTAQTWTFGTDGVLTAPGDLTTTGNISAGNIDTGIITLTNGSQIRDTAGAAVAFGVDAGANTQGIEAVAIGLGAGRDAQGNNAIAIGESAGQLTQGIEAIAIGRGAGANTQGTRAVAISIGAGSTGQSEDAIAIGYNAGTTSQSDSAVAIGKLAGETSQSGGAVAIGVQAGQDSQSLSAVAIGSQAGQSNQGQYAVAIGDLAGNTSQGLAAVAIGALAGETSQGNNSIIINATNAALDQTTANTFTVAPVRNDVANVAEVMFYNTTSKEVTYGNTISVAGNVSAGNISGGNLISTNGVYANIDFVAGDRANASAIKTRIVSDTDFSYIQTGNGTVGSTGNIVFSPYSDPTQRVVIDTSTGNLTAQNFIGNTAGFALGYRDIPQVSFTGNATMAAADAGKHFYSTESTDYILTIADNSAVTWPVGTAITVVNRGTGNITVAQAAGVSLYLAGNSSAGNRTVSTYGMATVLNVAANVWMINGTGVA